MNTIPDESNAAGFNRRRFLAAASALGGSALLCAPGIAATESALETRKIRVVYAKGMCQAPVYIAKELLPAEGFTDIDYVEVKGGTGSGAVAAGDADFSMWDFPGTIPLLDEGGPIVVLAGVHSGCWDLYGNQRVQSIRDLSGKTVAVHALRAGNHVLLSSMLAYVGVDPKKNIKWLPAEAFQDTLRFFEQGEADAFMAFEPQQQELREKKIGHLIVNTANDRPWANYFCCMFYGNRDFVNKHPVATKRVLRALLKGMDTCTHEPERVARLMVDKGVSSRYDFTLQGLKAIPFNVWRSYEPQATLRFYTLRLHEVGMLKSTPNEFIARHADWRFINDLRKEFKA